MEAKPSSVSETSTSQPQDGSGFENDGIPPYPPRVSSYIFNDTPVIFDDTPVADDPWTDDEPMAYDLSEFESRTEMAPQAGSYEAGNTSSPGEASYGRSNELDITPPISKPDVSSAHAADPPVHALTDRPEPPVRVLAVTPSLQEPGDCPLRLDEGKGGNVAEPASPPGSNSYLFRYMFPPVSNIPMDTPGLGPKDPIGFDSPILRPPSPGVSTQGPADTTFASETVRPSHYDTTKPTCSLNLVCYRSGSRGCDLQQIHCVLRSMYPREESFQSAIASQQQLIYADDQFFREMKQLYTRKMCGLFRRYFSLKTLRAFRILSYTPTTRPTVVPFDDFVLQEMMYAYRNPERLSGGHDWIKWVFRLRRTDKRHALEFVEGWNTTRIAVAGTAPWLSSCLVGIIWTAIGGDAQTAFTVASFILTSSSIVLALLAVISSIESSGGLAGTRG
ncbi:hypothetical protein CONLIGDRAFT_684805 [Coniochaeta ligniaria NRRL 30616]|uniref:Transmembrane protein n=1 Tax=Coniochaeta ligniaria NRRL 30616 TaxID=1408157 RepID=A0A1J7IB43_9PEZI|nr:hypothetical protein CONLIGDRAFT_684805 [Coniochaeta ligniaria NRRL 30616]